MKAITASALRKNLARYLDEVVEKGERIVIPRNVEEGDGRGVMIVPLEEADELDATEYLLASPANAERLRRSIAAARAGQTVAYDADVLANATEVTP